MIIYIAGPITGIDDYRQRFSEAEDELAEQGHIVLNPAALPANLGDLNAYMKICLPMIDAAEAVVFLEGWENSRGACREWGYAMGLGKKIIEMD